MTARVTLGGVDLGGSDAYSWELASGVYPVERRWVVSKERADAIAQGYPLLLEITPDGQPTIRFASVYVLEVLPGPDPFRRTLRVVDKRWRWARRWVSAGFNVKRTNGRKFLVNNTDKIENAVIQPEIEYAKWSLFPPENGTRRWHAEQIVGEVFRQIGEGNLGDGGFRLDSVFPFIDVEDFEVDDDGQTAIARALALLPGASVFVDYDGTVVVYNSLDQSERGVLEKVRPKAHTTLASYTEMVDKSHLRPSRVRVLFTPEVEMRFNYTEGGEVVRDSNGLRNVIPVPDVTLDLTTGATVARGTFVPLDTILESWGAFGLLGRALTTADMRVNALKHGSGALEHQFGNSPLNVFDPVNALRIRSALQHWRKTYQIAEVFLQRLSAIRATRVAVLNTETGLHAPAEAYCDWTRIPTYKGFAKFGNTNANQGWTVAGYADDLADAQVAPAYVSVVDAQAGVIRIDPHLDPFGLSQAIMLGYAKEAKLPSQMTGEANRTALDLYAQWGLVELSDTFQLAVILTVVPATPNDLRKFHEEIVDATDVGESNARGPEAVVRVFEGVTTARYAWSDDYGDQLVDAVRGLGRLPDPGIACVNIDQVKDVAKATAQRFYEIYRDRPEGAVAVDMDPTLRPTGTVSSVQHNMSGGVTESLVQFRKVKRVVDIWPFLNSSTRRALRFVLHQGTSP